MVGTKQFLIDKLLNLSRLKKKFLVVFLDTSLCVLTSWLAFALRFDEFLSFSAPLYFASFLSILIALPIFIRFGLYHAIFRFNGWYATRSLIQAILLYSILYCGVIFFFEFKEVPRSVGFIQPMLLFISIGLSRLAARLFFNLTIHKKYQSKVKAFLIYGAGLTGQQIASGLRQVNGLNPVAFIDDNIHLQNTIINGLRVYSPTEIKNLVAFHEIDSILLATPTISISRRKEILMFLSNFPVHVRIVPALADMASGVINVENIREVNVDDILGREPIVVDKDILKQDISGKVILITGAGGSIGSELCRQILDLQPKVLVLFEISEFALYTIQRELTLKNSTVTIIPILASVLDGDRFLNILQGYNVDIVFHAAAYKHVPIIEINPIAGVWNNIFGTLRVVNAVCQANVGVFVLISTDKAVRPTNIMGCTKRFAELIVQAKFTQFNSVKKHKQKLTMVRFGNVLASSGSVVNVFKEQIKNGGPLYVTHPEIIRYFMTIPEAAGLVLQAASIGRGGDIMLLDMGQPIKIFDLAKRMIHLSGFSEEDIEIKFTGLRQGEKLFEELLIGDNAYPTRCPQIMRAEECGADWDELQSVLIELESAIKFENIDVILKLLKKVVPEFDHKPYL